MGKWLFLAFTVIPVVELWLLVRLGGVVGAGPTIGLVLLTGAVGAFLAKQEGLRVLRDWQGAMERGRLPEDGVLSGLLVLVGGVLLVTPGMMTDVVGFALLLPQTRRPIADRIRARVEEKIRDGAMRVETQGFGANGPFAGTARGPSASTTTRRPAETIEMPPQGE